MPQRTSRNGAETTNALRVTLRLKDVEHLFTAPALSPFDPYYAPESVAAGIDFLIAEMKRAPRVSGIDLVVLLPAERLEANPALEARTREAIRRYAETRASTARQEHAIELRTARRVGGTAVAFFVVANLLSLQYAHSGQLFGASGVWLDVLMEGVSVGAWVALWWPLDHLFTVWQHRFDERVYHALADVDVRLMAGP